MRKCLNWLAFFYDKTEGINKCLPGIKSIDEGVKIYRQFYSKDDENQYKIIAFGLVFLNMNGKRHIKKWKV